MNIMKTIRLNDDYRIKNGKLEAFVCLKSATWNADDNGYNDDAVFGFVESKLQIGTEVILYSHTDVSPNALRNNTDTPEFKIRLDNGEGIPGNMNKNIKRYHGWRGTTCDISTDAHGLRKIVKIRQLKNGLVSITLSNDLNPETK